MGKNKIFFDSETGRSIANLALKAELIEKKIIKDGSGEQVSSYYNTILEAVADFEKKLSRFEDELGKDDE